MSDFRPSLFLNLLLTVCFRSIHLIGCFIGVFVLFHFWHAIAETNVVIRPAYDFKRLCLFEGRHKTWLVGGRRFLLSVSTELVKLIRAPRVQLVVFSQGKYVFQAAINALDSFRKSALAA